MKLSITTGDLRQAVRHAVGAMPNRPAQPALSGVLLTVADDLTATCFDFDRSHTATVDCGVGEPGRVLVGGKLLDALLDRLDPRSTTDLSVEGSRLHLTCGRTSVQLPTMVAEDFPALPVAPEQVGTIDAEALRAAVDVVQSAVSRDSTLAQLTGIQVEAGEILRLVASDRYRLHVVDVEWEPTGEATVLVPVGPMLAGARMMSGTVTVHADDARFGLSDGSRTVTTRLIDGTFPDYPRLIREESDRSTYIVADTAALTGALRRCEPLVTGHKPIRLDFGSDGISVRSEGEDGQVLDHCPAEVEGEMTVHVQPAFLLDALSAVCDGQVRIGCGETSTRPLRVDGLADRMALVMPVRPA